ncbi:MAG: glutamate-5-semialdehyde dehydrogenase [Bacteroidales bacterium]|jgi:glutamate-5-semialdehyde dehydrogenase|nr:glutamate-5-semialdehyde dehydrogenase [Bacteroidales bacterium]
MDYTSIFKRVKSASRSFVDSSKAEPVLLYLADLLEKETNLILAANQKDLERMQPADYKYDRLRLTQQRISGIAKDMRNVAGLPSPLKKTLMETTIPNGLVIKKVSVPIGVIGVIYEARPNVTCDVFSLCLKSGNACILKGGSDAQFSNEALVELIHNALKHFNINPDMIVLLPPMRESTTALLSAKGWVDIVIPRGSQELIHFVCEHAKIPVIETGAGIVHTYLDKTGNADKASAIINNAKTRRVSVCNALDCLIVHHDKLKELHHILNPLADSQVTIYADDPAYEVLKRHYPANLLQHADSSSFGTEFLDYKMAVKTVNSIEKALEHIELYGSMHSEAIISENIDNIELFLNRVDAAVVYANASTAFTDGAQFGLGAEIGISTQKLHARGPMALNELTSYKWTVTGNGQIRTN